MIPVLVGLITGVLGRLGGAGDDFWKKHPKWPRWIFQSWVRDWLIGPVCCLVAYLAGVHCWWILATILLTGAALSTYWDFLFGYDNYTFHGLMVGLAAFPIAYCSGEIQMFLLRIIILTAWMGVWSALIKNDNLNEFGRYFIVGYTLFMIC
jgi:hypothetical protein